MTDILHTPTFVEMNARDWENLLQAYNQWQKDLAESRSPVSGKHRCSGRTCRFVQVERIFVCRESGDVHRCGAACNAIVTRQESSVCAITGRVLFHGAATSMQLGDEQHTNRLAHSTITTSVAPFAAPSMDVNTLCLQVALSGSNRLSLDSMAQSPSGRVFFPSTRMGPGPLTIPGTPQGPSPLPSPSSVPTPRRRRAESDHSPRSAKRPRSSDVSAPSEVSTSMVEDLLRLLLLSPTRKMLQETYDAYKQRIAMQLDRDALMAPDSLRHLVAQTGSASHIRSSTRRFQQRSPRMPSSHELTRGLVDNIVTACKTTWDQHVQTDEYQSWSRHMRSRYSPILHCLVVLDLAVEGFYVQTLAGRVCVVPQLPLLAACLPNSTDLGSFSFDARSFNEADTLFRKLRQSIV